MNTITSFRGKYAFLSNFEPCVVVLDGVRYGCVERAFQAAKTLNIEERKRISLCESTADAKRYGRKVTLREDWENKKVQIMYELLKQKFSQPVFAERLLATGDAILIEGNNHGDRFWGQVNGEGKNMLGQLLMNVRKELQNGNYC